MAITHKDVTVLTENLKPLAADHLKGLAISLSGEGDGAFVASVLLADVRNGCTQDDVEIARFLGASVEDVFLITSLLLKNNAWPLNGLDISDGITFNLAVNAGLGRMRRIDGEQWQLTEDGLIAANSLPGATQ